MAKQRMTQQERRSEAEGRLLEAAADLIATSGVSAMTLAAVGERAGYSRGIVGHHFGSKAALMERLVSAVHREFFDALADAVDDTMSPPDRLVALVRTFGELLVDLPAIHRAFLVLWASSAGATSDVRQGMAKSDRVFRSHIAAILSAGVDGGFFAATTDVEAVAVTTAGTLRGVGLQRMIDPEGFDLGSAFVEIVDALVFRLSP